MQTDIIIQIISGVIQTGAIGFVVYMIINGLKIEVKALQKNVDTQNETIKTMDKRNEETEKIGDLYKKMVSDFPKALDDYQTVITKTKESIIYELKSKVDEQDSVINKLKEFEKNNGDNNSKRNEIIGKLFLDKTKKDLLTFIQKLHPNNELTYKAMLNNNLLDNLIRELNIQMNIVDESKIKEFTSPLNMEEYNVRTVTYGINGNYMITFKNELYITKNRLLIFKNEYEL